MFSTFIQYLSALAVALATVGIIGISSAQAAQNHNQKPTPIQFDKGHIATTITGKLPPAQNEHWYQFDALKGQYAVVNLAPLTSQTQRLPETANVGVLHMPDGSQDGNKGGIIYQGCLPISGTYRLRIARNLMATQNQAAGYSAEIVVLPQYASQALCP